MDASAIRHLILSQRLYLKRHIGLSRYTTHRREILVTQAAIVSTLWFFSNDARLERRQEIRRLELQHPQVGVAAAWSWSTSPSPVARIQATSPSPARTCDSTHRPPRPRSTIRTPPASGSPLRSTAPGRPSTSPMRSAICTHSFAFTRGSATSCSFAAIKGSMWRARRHIPAVAGQRLDAVALKPAHGAATTGGRRLRWLIPRP